MKKNAYMLKRQAERDALERAFRSTFQQYMMDTLTITLNDPDVMGKDVFGASRLKKLYDAWGKTYDRYFEALTRHPEADYKREKLDEAIKQIMKENFFPFSERYEFLPEIKY